MIQISQVGQEITGLPLKNHLVAPNAAKHLPQNGNWTAMKESTLVRNHSAALSLTTHALTQVQ